MKQRYITLFLAVAAVSLTLAGCHKENADLGMKLMAEGFGNGQKVAVYELASYWVNGETLRINGVDKTINVDGADAYISDVTEAEAYRAIYPASIGSSAALDADVVNVTLPSSYEWRVDGSGRQLIEVPMAAKGTGSERLYFRHLTAAITVQITNHYGFAVVVDDVTVSSTEGSKTYQLSGPTSVTLGTDDLTVTPAETDVAANRQVTIDFNDAQLTVQSGEKKNVQVPVLPVGEGNKFTVSVTVHKYNNTEVSKTYTQTQATGGAMARKEMGYAGSTVGFLFSVAADRQVIFSQGNLEYQASTGTWRFAEDQNFFIGNNAGNNADTTTRKTQSDWIDLFGWGTSGWNNGNVKYMPYDANVKDWTNIYYGPKSGDTYYDLTGDYANSDWGVYNRISNGGNKTGMWRTPTISEWSYLTNYSRGATNTVNNITRAKYTYASIANMHNGIIFFPDTFTVPTLTNSTWGPINQKSAYTTSISESDWYALEAAGCIFLPAAGGRSAAGSSQAAPSVSDVNNYGRYWSSTKSTNNSKACAAQFQSDGNFTASTSSSYLLTKSSGYSVRLIKDVTQ